MKTPEQNQLHARELARVAVLCCSGRSIYHHMAGVLAYDERRDARTFKDSFPVVAHPPCRTWSKYLWHMAKPADWQGEQDLGRFCVANVIRNGGVLEHPAGSRLWADRGLPEPGRSVDPFLYTLYVEQGCWGYRSRKPTWVLVLRLPRQLLPAIPFAWDRPGNIEFAGKEERSRTLRGFAEWLLAVARLTWWQHLGPAGLARRTGELPSKPAGLVLAKAGELACAPEGMARIAELAL